LGSVGVPKWDQVGTKLGRGGTNWDPAGAGDAIEVIAPGDAWGWVPMNADRGRCKNRRDRA